MKSANWPQTILKDCEKVQLSVVSYQFSVSCESMKPLSRILLHATTKICNEIATYEKCRVAPDQTEPHHLISGGNEMH